MTIYQTPPPGFSSQFDAAGVCCETRHGEILVLKRHPSRYRGNKLGLPAGRAEPGENAITCAIREAFEEAGLTLDENRLEPLAKLYVVYPDQQFTFTLFRARLGKNSSEISIILRPDEHIEHRWSTPYEATRFNPHDCIDDFTDTIEVAYPFLGIVHPRQNSTHLGA